jgi:hypothetical protein
MHFESCARRTLAGALLASSLILCAAAVSLADDPIVWPFDIRTTGADVHWLSPSAVRPDAELYVMSYQITQVEATVRYLFLEFTQDITDQIPPEDLSGSDYFPGPAPFLLQEGDLAYPLPPDPPSASAHVRMGLNASGNGYVDLTNVYLGTVVLNVPPFGNVRVQIVAIHVVGTETIQAFNLRPGDLNCDGRVNFDDINPFVLALSDPVGYHTAFPNCTILNADINGDGAVTFHDINPFVALLTGQ